ncbi:MAG: molybdenum cofactor guanylyltransferase [Dehalococcoidales bacterium]
METSCIVLAGGKSSRLSFDKVLETVGNRSLLQLVISGVASLSREVIIVTNSGQIIPQSIDYSRLKVVNDIYPGKGPLGGIYTGLATSISFYNLVVASDMPFLNQALLCYMIQLSANFDLVVPRVDKLVEPLHAVYTKRCLAPIEHMIKQDKLSVSQLFPLVKTRYVEAEEIEKFDRKHLSFFNVNTKADLKRARELARGYE